MENDWLDDVTADTTAMSQINKAVSKLKELLADRQQKEMQFQIADEKYQNEVKKVTELLRQNGLEALKCSDGSKLEVVQKIRCSITKGNKNGVADWLREQGAEQLVTSQLIIDSSHKADLDSMGIAYDESVEMNTNSVKAWVRGEMEMGNVSVAQLPKGLSWFSYDEVEWS